MAEHTGPLLSTALETFYNVAKPAFPSPGSPCSLAPHATPFTLPSFVHAVPTASIPSPNTPLPSSSPPLPRLSGSCSGSCPVKS